METNSLRLEKYQKCDTDYGINIRSLTFETIKRMNISINHRTSSAKNRTLSYISHEQEDISSAHIENV